MRRRLDKLVAKQAFDAVNEVLSHYQTWYVQLETRGEKRSEELLDTYARVRRLRDYFRNLVAVPCEASVELEDDDSNLLVSCCLFTVQAADLAIARGEGDEKRLKWLDEKVQRLFGLARSFATRPTEMIKRPGESVPPSGRLREMIAALNEEIRSSSVGVASEPNFMTDETAVESSSGLIRGGAAAANWMNDEGPVATARLEPNVGVRSLAPSLHDKTDQLDVSRGIDEDSADERESVASPEPAPRGRQKPQSRSYALIGLDPDMIKDPRLRSMLAMDLKALSSALERKDVRVAAIMLSAVFEAMVTDLGLQRRAELGLRGTPDTWNMQEIVADLLGSRCAGPDRNTLFHLQSCKNLVRPAVQLSVPIVVTAATLTKMVEFIRSFMKATGLTGANVAAPAED